ncbi:PmoA family protein [Streptomyces boncukensis]|uniref:Oxidoreductase n=1 Tax=Streptomyces boncukensis TaxID=2711219 RepID=A0A6G4WTH1_9ACTN|nr:PmoA family protein [Streptomyces boncukensis]NGO68579.1 oxidoreductase [Streptomyces boncukensis]
MSEPITVTHTHGERVAVASGGTELMTYVYAPDPVAYESRKPYVHPMRTLGGSPVTGYRPSDHRWHKGLQMTASHLSGQNFWGGHSYMGPERGYEPIHERIGRMRHDAFDAFDVAEDRLRFTELLTWIANGGEEWARERRTVEVHSVEAEEGGEGGSWALDWTLHLTNTRSQDLHFGSPTTAGREMAGYTGLHWRGPRDFAGGDVLGPDGRGGAAEAGAADMMGTRAPWLAFTGEHDGRDGHSTLVFAHAPENAGAIHDSHWFVRSEPVPTVAFSWAFHEEFALPPGESFSYRYRVVVADGAWDGDRVASCLKAHGW